MNKQNEILTMGNFNYELNGKYRLRENCRLLLAAIVMLTVPVSLMATPRIDSVIGSVSEGEKITLIGENFTSANIEVAVKDKAGGQALVSENSEFRKLSTKELWRTHGSPWATPLANVLAESNARTIYQGEGKSYNQYLTPFVGKHNNAIFVSWDYKPSKSPLSQGGSNKFLRIWDRHDGEGTRISWTQMLLGYSGAAKTRWENWTGKVGDWNRMEIWVNGDTGLIHATVNGKTEFSFNDFEKQDKDIGLNIKLLGFDPSSSSNYPDLVSNIDNLYVSTSRARVTISSAPTWEQANTSDDIQLPLEWTNNKVTILLSSEHVDLAKPTYLYVIDENGEANPKGYRICGECPKAAAIDVD